MNLTECYAYEYVLKPDDQHTAELNPTPHQNLKPGHKLVLAFASISSYGEHTTQPPGSAGYAYFTEYAQNGQLHQVPDALPLVIGPNITDLKWNMKAAKSWIRGSFVIMAFD